MTVGRPRDRLQVGVLLVPYAVGLLVLVLIPAVLTFAMAFTDADLLTPAEPVGLDNFRELAGDEVFAIALRNSLVYVAVAVPLRLLGALGLALVLHRRIRGSAAYRSTAYLPTIVPDMAYALLWLWLLNPLYGPINVALGALGLPQPAWSTDGTAAMAGVIIMSLFTLGEGFIVAMATRQEVPGQLYELATLEGAGPWQAFRRVTLPFMAPTLVLLTLRDIAFSLQASFVPALIVTGGGPPPYSTTFLPLFVYRTGFEYLRYGYAAAATLVMFLITLVLVVVQLRIVRRWRRAFIV